jgi:cysteinyl-tRNA synthetase
MDSAKNARKALVSRVAKVLAEDKDFTYTEEAILSKNDWSEAASKVIAAFTKAMEDDLSTPKALSELQVAIKNPEIQAAEKLALIAKLDSVLGLDLIAKAKESLATPAETGNANSDPEIDALVVERNEAKKAKNWARADEIRNILKEKGIVLVDTPEGTIWKKE